MVKILFIFISAVFCINLGYSSNTNEVTERTNETYKHNPKLQKEIQKKDPAQAKFDDGKAATPSKKPENKSD